MIDAQQAAQIACDFKEAPRVAGVMTTGRDFVVGFSIPPGNNLPVFVDGETGEPRILGETEYATMMHELRPAE